MVDVVTLTRGSYQENLEFLQWLKAYYEQHVPQGLVYDPVGRREGKPAQLPPAGAGSASVAPSDNAPPAAAAAAPAVATSAAASVAPVAAAATTTAPAEKKAAVAEKKKPAPQPEKQTATSTRSTTRKAPESKPAEAPRDKPAPLRTVVNNDGVGSGASRRSGSASTVELEKKLHQLQLEKDRAEQERDFYFSKLRDVEIWTQTYPDQSNVLVKEVQTILYSTE